MAHIPELGPISPLSFPKWSPVYALAINTARLRAAWQKDHYLECAVIRRAGQDMANRIKAMRQHLVDVAV